MEADRPATDQGPSRPGTAVRRRGRRRVEEILDVAVQLILDEGYSGFALRRIAQLAGISLGNLQYYFPSRGSLLEAVMTREFERSSASFEAWLGRSEGVSQDLWSTAIEFVLRDQDDPRSCILFWELWAMAVREPAVSAVMDTYYERFVGVVTELVSGLDPKLDAAASRARAATIVSLLEGASLLRGTGKPTRMDLPGFEREIQRACRAIAAGTP